MSRQQRNTPSENQNHSHLDNDTKEVLKNHLTNGEDNSYLSKIEKLVTDNMSLSDILNAPLTRSGKTALHILSARKKDAAIPTINKIIENGANPNHADHRQWTALHHATTNGNFKVAELLLEQGAKVNAALKNGNTPLHLAAKKMALPEKREDKYRHMHELLLNNGANEKVENKKGKTPEQLKPKRPELNPEILASVQEVVEEESNKKTLLDALLKDKDFEWYWDNVTKFICNEILADIEVSGVSSDKAIIITAIINTPLDDNGNTALHLLSGSTTTDHNIHNTIVRLIGSGANVHQTTTDGYTALHCAAEAGNKGIVGLLWDHLADVSMETANGETPLALAEKNGHPDVCGFLATISSHKKVESDSEETSESKLADGSQSNSSDTSPAASEKEIKPGEKGLNPRRISAPAPHVVVKRGLFGGTKKQTKDYSPTRANKESTFFDPQL